MSKQKKITYTIAKILAERVREKLSETSMKTAEKHKEKILASKDYAEYEKLRDQEREARSKMKKLEEKIVEKYSTPMMKIRMSAMYADRPASVSISENKAVTVESIRDSILIEDYFADSPVSHEELVNKMVKKFL